MNAETVATIVLIIVGVIALPAYLYSQMTAEDWHSSKPQDPQPPSPPKE